MIIKFKEKDKWVMFGEIDHIEYEEVKYTDEPVYELSFFTKNMNDATVIRCFNPIYIMNDQGRTVETI
jgi:hypothetical protein